MKPRNLRKAIEKALPDSKFLPLQPQGGFEQFQSEEAFETYADSKLAGAVHEKVSLRLVQGSFSTPCLLTPGGQNRASDLKPDILAVHSTSAKAVTAGNASRVVPAAVAYVGDRRYCNWEHETIAMLTEGAEQSVCYAGAVMHGFSAPTTLGLCVEVFCAETRRLYVLTAEARNVSLSPCMMDPEVSLVTVFCVVTESHYVEAVHTFWWMQEQAARNHMSILEDSVARLLLFPSDNTSSEISLWDLVEILTPSTEIGYGAHATVYFTAVSLSEGKIESTMQNCQDGALFNSDTNAPMNRPPKQSDASKAEFRVAQVYRNREAARNQAQGLHKYGHMKPAVLDFAYKAAVVLVPTYFDPLPRSVDVQWDTISAMLRRIHQDGLVHRDVALRNLRLDADGQVVLVDFGLELVKPGEHGVAGMVEELKPEKLAQLASTQEHCQEQLLWYDATDDEFALEVCKALQQQPEEAIEARKKQAEEKLFSGAASGASVPPLARRAKVWLHVQDRLLAATKKNTGDPAGCGGEEIGETDGYNDGCESKSR